jgi:hypothetical protein
MEEKLLLIHQEDSSAKAIHLGQLVLLNVQNYAGNYEESQAKGKFLT